MKTKQELIREAYGEYYEELKEFINRDTGACLRYKVPGYHMKRGILNSMFLSTSIWWPRGLKGDIDNNGWAVITSETKVDSSKVYEMYTDGAIHPLKGTVVRQILQGKHRFTHIKELILSKPPIWK